MKYIKLVIAIDDDYQESLISELAEMEFDAFEQLDDQVITYVPMERFSDVNREHIEGILRAYPGDGFIESEEVVEDRNWNEEWEKTIQPKEIGRFFVKPTWSGQSAPPGTILLEIDPKMSFGTGYHETTQLMLEMLPDVVQGGESVMDAGTGTGILAIASVRLGASEVFAFDIDEWSVTNARENIYLNEVSPQIEIMEGSAEVIPEDALYDVILANIERNPILHLLPHLTHHLQENGTLLLSGLLQKDEQVVIENASGMGLSRDRKKSKGEWIALQLSNASLDNSVE